MDLLNTSHKKVLMVSYCDLTFFFEFYLKLNLFYVL